MFDIGFMELLLIGVVALLVLGPDKLPGAIRTGALWLGRARRSFNKVKAEIEQQLNTDEIRRQLHNESILADIEKARKSADKLIKETKEEIKDAQDDIQSTIGNTTGSSATGSNTTKLTTSADEGVPTPPPDPAVTEARASVEARYKNLANNSDDDDASEQSGTAGDTDADSTETADIAAETPAADEKPKQAVEDFYNSPPQGIVTVKGRDMSAPDNKPSTSKKTSD